MIKFWKVASIYIFIFSTFAAMMGEVSASDDAPSMQPDCTHHLLPVSSCNRCVQPRCCCLNVTTNPDSVKKSEVCDQSNCTKHNTNASNEVEQISKLTEMTLKGVENHADFLASLWKWTIIIGSIVAGLLAFFGFVSFKDLKNMSQKYADEIIKFQELEVKFAKLNTEITANHVVMMCCNRAQLWIDTASEFERRAQESGIQELEKNRLTDAASEKFKSVVENIQEVLRNNKPTDHAVCALVYNLYGYAQYKQGDISSALAAAKKSLESRPDDATALYNASCYAAKMNLVDQSVTYLKRAVEINHTFLADAQNEEDFKGIKSAKEFTDFVGA